ncbi:hypothetical protein D3C73_1518160 [compost metagenome]
MDGKARRETCLGVRAVPDAQWTGSDRLYTGRNMYFCRRSASAYSRFPYGYPRIPSRFPINPSGLQGLGVDPDPKIDQPGQFSIVLAEVGRILKLGYLHIFYKNQVHC